MNPSTMIGWAFLGPHRVFLRVDSFDIFLLIFSFILYFLKILDYATCMVGILCKPYLIGYALSKKLSMKNINFMFIS